MFRYFIYLAYDGTNYHGWQIQPNGSSVQETLMKALHTFLRDEAIEVVGAGSGRWPPGGRSTSRTADRRPEPKRPTTAAIPGNRSPT